MHHRNPNKNQQSGTMLLKIFKKKNASSPTYSILNTKLGKLPALDVIPRLHGPDSVNQLFNELINIDNLEENTVIFLPSKAVGCIYC